MSVSAFEPVESRAASIGGVGPAMHADLRVAQPVPRRTWPMRPASAVDWRVVAERYGDLAYAVARNFGLQKQDAAEVFQNTWLVVLEKEEVPEEEGMARWLAAIASWESRRILSRRRTRQLEEDHAESIPDLGEPEPQAILQRAEEEQALRDALAELGSRDRELIVDLFLSPKPLPYSVVAARLGIAVNSVSQLRQRALDKLRAALEKAGMGRRQLAAAGAGGWYP